MLSLIVAVSENNVIGNNGIIPWYIPEDLKRFKELTLGHPVIMGRKTYESIVNRIGKPLPKRKSIVLSRDSDYSTSFDIYLANSVENALTYCKDELPFVIGGSSVYGEALPLVDVMEITRVHRSFEGDAFFPDVDLSEWKLVKDSKRFFSEHSKTQYSFSTYHRNNSQ